MRGWGRATSYDRRVSVLGFAILELLAREPMTGYDITRRMNAPIGYMWSTSHPQVYGELAALESTGRVRSTVVPGRGPRDTKRYQITATGKRALKDWVDSPLRRLPVRNELMLRVRAFWLISPARARAFIESVMIEHEQRLAVYEDEEADFTRQKLDVRDPASWAFAAFATVQAGLRAQRAMVDWCQWLLANLEAREAEVLNPSSDH